MTTNTRDNGLADEAEFKAKVNRIARLEVRIQRRKADMDAELQKIRKPHEDKIAEMEQERDALLALANAYATRNRMSLLGPKRKSGATELATYGFRMGKDKLELYPNMTWDKVMEGLRQCGRSRFIRTKTEVDKEAVLAKMPRKDMARFAFGVTKSVTFFVKPKDAASLED